MSYNFLICKQPVYILYTYMHKLTTCKHPVIRICDSCLDLTVCKYNGPHTIKKLQVKISGMSYNFLICKQSVYILYTCMHMLTTCKHPVIRICDSCLDLTVCKCNGPLNLQTVCIHPCLLYTSPSPRDS